jgi:DNA (cytosine-5)-methyltransferase 1
MTRVPKVSEKMHIVKSKKVTPIDASLAKKKHARILLGEAPRTLDLFAGCGGLTLGFELAGFKSIGAVEFDSHAARSHAMNFMSHLEGQAFEAHAKAKDITLTEPEELMTILGHSGPIEEQVDVIVGGPPCQAFARVGRAKLREVAAHPEAFLQDPRGNLYLRYLHYVKKLKPIAIVMENVPDVLNYGGHNIAEETCEILDSWGYSCGYTLLNSAFYGVPQMRERMFLMAVAKPVADSIVFPDPTHWIELPRGYLDARKIALQTVVNRGSTYYRKIESVSRDKLQTVVTAYDALKDLPILKNHLADPSIKKPNTPREYGQVAPSAYGVLMRNWRNKTTKLVEDHVIRLQPRDFPIFRLMKPADEYPEAHALALRLLDRKLASYVKEKGKLPSKNSRMYQSLVKETVPPYDVSKFPNKWRKMEADAPARTLMAHLGKDCYSHIHYDSAQARTISVREAARLQSFPDQFKFSGAMGASFRQIGNAVPPLVAQAIAKELMMVLRG